MASEPTDIDMRESDDDGQDESRKRASRACDQCRKTKSKCEKDPPDATRCKSCFISGSPCSYSDHIYKRGPPKGYIHALERRWQEVESILGAVMACEDPRIRSLLAELRRDDLARGILDRVDDGPYGPAGRLTQTPVSNTAELFGSIFKNTSRGSAQPSQRRQSRVSREIVSAGKGEASTLALTSDWQDSVIALMKSATSLSTSTAGPSAEATSAGSSSPTVDASGSPYLQRRRFDATQDPSQQLMAHSGYADIDITAEPSHAKGQLSLNEDRQVRFHGNTSGMHLLPAEAVDARQEGGLWKMPMARVWPYAKSQQFIYRFDDSVPVDMPPQALQDRLVDAYFRHIHPSFPIIHKAGFLAEYRQRHWSNMGGSDAGMAHRSLAGDTAQQQSVSMLLLLCMYCIASRFLDEAPTVEHGEFWEAGCDYFDRARDILAQTYHHSRVTTCQVLLLLGYRAFGIGVTEQGWMFIGMAIRMAHDLGLHRNPDHWKYDGHDLFSHEAKEARKQVWWACCLLDKYSSVCMGRPPVIVEGNYDTLLPALSEEEDIELSQPDRSRTVKFSSASPAMTASTFHAACLLSTITGYMTTLVYSVQQLKNSDVTPSLASVEQQLDQWLIDLDPLLRYGHSTQQEPPPPNVLLLHIQYWSAVLLLHRAFVPNWSYMEDGIKDAEPMGLRALELAQSAASHISTLAMVWQETFGLQCCSPQLPLYLFNSGVMHVIGLALAPSDPRASLGLDHCMAALKDFEVVWPSAAHARALLEGSERYIESLLPAFSRGNDKGKRQATDAFGSSAGGQNRNQALDASTDYGPSTFDPQLHQGAEAVQDMNALLTAQMLGLDIPGVAPTSQYLYPGYDFWSSSASEYERQYGSGRDPRSVTLPDHELQQPGATSSSGTTGGNMDFEELPGT